MRGGVQVDVALRFCCCRCRGCLGSVHQPKLENVGDIFAHTKKRTQIELTVIRRSKAIFLAQIPCCILKDAQGVFEILAIKTLAPVCICNCRQLVCTGVLASVTTDRYPHIDRCRLLVFRGPSVRNCLAQLCCWNKRQVVSRSSTH